MPTSDWSPHEIRENVIVFTLFYTIISKMTKGLALIQCVMSEEVVNQWDRNIGQFVAVADHELRNDIQIELLQRLNTYTKERHFICGGEVYRGKSTREGKGHRCVPIECVVHWDGVLVVGVDSRHFQGLSARLDDRLIIIQFVVYLTQVMDVFLCRTQFPVLIHGLRFRDYVLVFPTLPTDLISYRRHKEFQFNWL